MFDQKYFSPHGEAQTVMDAELNSFTYMLSLPQWHCKIGRVTLKRGVTMHVPFNCFDWFA
ncbi:hypothetical protein [Agrobacterium tumefaciens]|uniref:hypothetical protein n=1 Tax=Agrobacterium tumefaciens TaxID=358 RepID=UPI001268FEA1